MQIILEIPQNRYAFFKALMHLLSFPKIVSVKPESTETVMSKEVFFEELGESIAQMKLQMAGKLPEKTAWQMLEDVERELANE